MELILPYFLFMNISLNPVLLLAKFSTGLNILLACSDPVGEKNFSCEYLID